MIDFYAWPTPNCRKVSILLEELELEYNVHPIDIGNSAQFEPGFLAVSPNNKVPAIVDHDSGVTLFESGAILLYLAEKHGRFLPKDPKDKAEVIQWLMWQMGGLGPMAGQAHHYLRNNPGKAPYAEDRFKTEVARLYGVLNQHLAQRNYVGAKYSIADMAIWPWVSRHEWHQIDLMEYPNVRAWYQRLLGREAIQKGYDVPHATGEIPRGGVGQHHTAPTLRHKENLMIKVFGRIHGSPSNTKALVLKTHGCSHDRIAGRSRYVESVLPPDMVLAETDFLRKTQIGSEKPFTSSTLAGTGAPRQHLRGRGCRASAVPGAKLLPVFKDPNGYSRRVSQMVGSTTFTYSCSFIPNVPVRGHLR